MKKLVSFSLLLFFCGCSSQLQENQHLIVVNEVNVWFNLMPGGEPTFHFSGQIGVDIEIDETIELSEVEIFQSDKSIVKLKPFFTRLTKQLPQNNKYLYLFGLREGLSTKGVNPELPINVKLFFKFQNESIIKHISDIPIEKVY